jgi:DNA-binding transcriptional LysR family regulator
VELRQLQYFVAVAEHLHFGRAAEELAIGQPAVSQQIARLERELGVALFDRSARSVSLTAAGTRVLPYARSALAAAGRVRTAACSPAAGGTTKPLRIGSSTGLGERLGIVLSSLAAVQPATETVLVSAPTRVRLDRVAGGQLDAAFVRGVTSAPGVELIEVWRDRLLVVLPANHELAKGNVVELTDLADLALHIVSRKLNPPLVDLVMGACAAAGFTPTLGSHVEGLDNTHALIATGPPSWTVIYEAHARALHHPHVAFRLTRPELVMPTALAVAADATSRAVAPLLRACSAAEQLVAIDQQS